MLTYYIKGIGAFRGAGDTNRWLKIRSIEPDGNRISIKIKFAGKEKYLALAGDRQTNIEFAKGTWPNLKPCSWYSIKEELGFVKE